MSKPSLLITIGGISALVILGGLIFEWKTTPEAGAYDQFAQCLRDKGATMYGADWCPHCQNQKRMFGDSFKFVPYVECPDDPKRCIAEGVEGYPTWKFQNGAVLSGEQSLERLSSASTCPLIKDGTGTK